VELLATGCQLAGNWLGNGWEMASEWLGNGAKGTHCALANNGKRAQTCWSIVRSKKAEVTIRHPKIIDGE